MSHLAPQPTPLTAVPGQHPTPSHAAAVGEIAGFKSPTLCVGTVGQELSDELREEAIQRAGKAIEHHMAIYAADGCLAARGDADRARLLMQQLIAGRSATQVERMQQAQFERMALEPGAERA